MVPVHWDKLPLLLANLLLLLAIASSGRELLALFPNEEATPLSPSTTASLRQTPANVSTAGTTQPMSTALAGLFSPPATATATGRRDSAPQPPPTPLKLTLVGVLASPEGTSRSRAIIEGAEGDDGVFAIGQELQPGVTLREVHSDRVVIQRNGRPETVSLQRPEPLPLEGPHRTLQAGGQPPPVTAPTPSAPSRHL